MAKTSAARSSARSAPTLRAMKRYTGAKCARKAFSKSAAAAMAATSRRIWSTALVLARVGWAGELVGDGAGVCVRQGRERGLRRAGRTAAGCGHT